MHTVTLYLVRHGQTIFNKTGRVQGWQDSPLTEVGRKVAVYCGRGLRNVAFDAAYSSDLMRASVTAQIILDQNEQVKPPLIERKTLREISFGHFDGGLNEDRVLASAKLLLGEENIELLNRKLATKEIRVRHMLNATQSIDESGIAETFEQMQLRAVKETERIVKEAHAKKLENVLVVSHGVTIASIVDYFPGVGIDQISDIKNASVSRLVYDGKDIRVVEVGSMEPAKLGREMK